MEKLKKKAKEMFNIGTEGATSMLGSMIGESIVGQVLPGLTTVYFSYKQNRIEKNIERYMAEMKLKEDLFNKRLDIMDSILIETFKNKHFGIVTDYVIDEVQEEKIKYIVNGLVNLASHETISEDFVLTYYDTLRDLRKVDIAVLMIYDDSNYRVDGKSYQSVLNEFEINYDQYESVREKLSRMGLLLTKREKEVDNLYENVIAVQKFLEELVKGKAKKLNTFKRLTKNDGFSLSPFGRNFIDFFMKEV